MLVKSRTHRPVFTLLILPVALLAMASALTTTTFAQSGWDHIKALPTETRLHVSADKGGATCKLVSVDDATLVCGKHTFQRTDVKSVKLTRYSTSYGAGAAIAGGVGAGIGVGLVSGDDLFKNDKGKAAVIGLGLGAVVGALVAGPADLFRGPTVYRR